MSTRYILTAESAEKIKEIFNTFDENGNRTLDRTELRRLFTALGERLTLNELEYAFQELDTNDSGKIEYGEFIAFLTT